MPRRDKERKKMKGRGERAEKEAVSYESRTAGRRIKISVNKRLRWKPDREETGERRGARDASHRKTRSGEGEKRNSYVNSA